MSIHLWQSGSPSGVIQRIKLSGSDRQELKRSVTQRFVIETGNRNLINGSVVLIINGLVYNSNVDQTDGSGDTDFYIEDNVVIINDPDNGGTIKIKDSDELLIFYRV